MSGALTETLYCGDTEIGARQLRAPMFILGITIHFYFFFNASINAKTLTINAIMEIANDVFISLMVYFSIDKVCVAFVQMPLFA